MQQILFQWGKKPKEVFQIFRGTSAWHRGEKGHTILFPGLDKSRCVPLSYIPNISMMNICFSNLSTSSPWQCSAISSSLCRSKQKLLVLLFMTSPHSVLSQFITGMLASWPNNTSRHCSSLPLPAKPPAAAAALISAVGRAPPAVQPLHCSPPNSSWAFHHPCRDQQPGPGWASWAPPLTELFDSLCPSCELRHKASSSVKI